MKIPPLSYQSPASLADAIKLLTENGDDAKIIAGGQSLMPLLAFRMLSPKLLIDLRRIPGLDDLKIDEDGVRLGAMVRWSDIEQCEALRIAHPLLAHAVTHVAHYQIRNRGTVGGSMAHADPAAEMPGIAVTCDASISLEGPGGRRSVRAADFFQGALTTAIEPNEIIVEIKLPPWPGNRRWAFAEFSKRRGDFAMAGVALFYDVGADGAACGVHVGVFGATDIPRRLPATERALEGCAIGGAAIAAAVETARREIDPPGDLHGSSAYRRALFCTLLERALVRSIEREALCI
jgi:carbon-monoxide dehydrogenase medium subunit